MTTQSQKEGLVLELTGEKEDVNPDRELWPQLLEARAKSMTGNLKITLPCGASRTFTPNDINRLPVEDIPCPCGDPDHFFIRFSDLRGT